MDDFLQDTKKNASTRTFKACIIFLKSIFYLPTKPPNMNNLDEKKQVIIEILNSLREFNPAIGRYDKSILKDFRYAVKLDNGRINLSHELVHDYELSPVFVDDDRLRAAANAFERNVEATTPGSPSDNVFSNVTPVQQSLPTNTRNKSSTSRTLLILGILIVLGLGGYYLYTQIYKENEANTKSDIRNSITDYVTVETNDYKFSELGGIKDLEVIVKNSSDYTLDNVVVEVSYIKKNGDVWRNQNVNTDMIGPHMQMTMKAPDTDRGTSVRCRIISVKSSSLGLTQE